MTPIYVVCQIELREGLEENKILTFSKLALTTREEHQLSRVIFKKVQILNQL